ncbi:alginate lyase family protein [Oceanicoccus sagamiensis]|uniref:Uncharacterized protein n=1 Tax=Oceanicoccus sagamiensis TaxID=716816 RepID=A0A1X9NAB6_9GAMM|nr:alginate lyase family protein [Oceanicoccus sagamiensis]ARN74101.1 hypothetical protein BST96_08175 [Oceanicoccus sagamiensis]
MKLTWYIKRLKVMGLRETVHRVYEQLSLQWLRIQQSRRKFVEPDPSSFSFCAGSQAQLPTLQWDRHANREKASSLLAGQWSALGFGWQWQSAGDWRRAPDTGSLWPDVFFGAIPYRQGNPYGDIRVAWEPSRLQQLVSLALLAQDDASRETAVRCFEQQLLSWVKSNPPYLGIHYVSAMECGLRLIAVCHATDMIRPYLQNSERVWSAVLQLVEGHADLIIKRLSLYSSAGNHTLAETAGLIYAGVLFPELNNAAKWKRVGLPLFEREADRQFNQDGGGIEQAFGYHLFVTDLANIVSALLASKGQPSATVQRIVDQACEFLSELFNSEFELPNVGDNDGGYALSPYLLSSKQLAKPRDGIRTFPDSGYSVFRDTSETGRMILFDHGPLGMAPSYGHGHSDCLSIIWREKNETLLLDAGTYTYTGDQRWRQYFRGVSAHNTVAVNHRHQARHESAFMWSAPYTPCLLDLPSRIDGYDVLLAYHTGYEDQGLRHYRCVIIGPEGDALVWDQLAALGPVGSETYASLFWHVGGQFLSENEDGGVFSTSTTSGAALNIDITGGDITVHYGDEDVPIGWHSPTYGEKLPIYTVEARHSGIFPHEFYTYISPASATISDHKKDQFETVLEKLRSYI